MKRLITLVFIASSLLAGQAMAQTPMEERHDNMIEHQEAHHEHKAHHRGHHHKKHHRHHHAAAHEEHHE